jgi:hypothetical protein
MQQFELDLAAPTNRQSSDTEEYSGRSFQPKDC